MLESLRRLGLPTGHSLDEVLKAADIWLQLGVFEKKAFRQSWSLPQYEAEIDKVFDSEFFKTELNNSQTGRLLLTPDFRLLLAEQMRSRRLSPPSSESWRITVLWSMPGTGEMMKRNKGADMLDTKDKAAMQRDLLPLDVGLLLLEMDTQNLEGPSRLNLSRLLAEYQAKVDGGTPEENLLKLKNKQDRAISAALNSAAVIERADLVQPCSDVGGPREP